MLLHAGAGCPPANTQTNPAAAIQVIITGNTAADITIDLVEANSSRDFGDLPDGTGGTTPYSPAIRGANHQALGLRLGPSVDSELSDNPSAASDGDDTNNSPDDEDGVLRDLNDLWTPGASVDLLVNVRDCTAPPCRLSGWIDWKAGLIG